MDGFVLSRGKAHEYEGIRKLIMPIAKTPGGNEYPLAQIPERCPYCHTDMLLDLIAATMSGDDSKEGANLEVAFQCNRNAYRRLFIGVYQRTKKGRNGKMIGPFLLKELIPAAYLSPDICEEVKEVSPSFREVYIQSSKAEASGLNEIAGDGYRKSLELLIKDFCIRSRPNDEEKIRQSSLENVIRDYVDDVGLRNCVKAAHWLGGDGGYYLRRWKDDDIKDLKILIELASIWIKGRVLTERFLSDVPNE